VFYHHYIILLGYLVSWGRWLSVSGRDDDDLLARRSRRPVRVWSSQCFRLVYLFIVLRCFLYFTEQLS